MPSVASMTLSLMLFYSQAVVAQPIPNWLPDDLKRQLPEWEIQQLGDSTPLWVLHREAMTPFVQGTLLLLPDPSQHPASPRHINFLRQAMNQHGWTTLALLPDATATTDQAALAALRQQLHLVLEQSDWQQGHLVVLAQGYSGYLLSQLEWTTLPRQPEAIVFLSSYHPEPANNRELAQRIAQLSMPVLDMAHDTDHLHISQTFEIRRQWGQKQANLLYRQRLLTGYPELEISQQRMYKEVYGWLNYLGL
ncbi:DUF3530 family protein [Alkalimonas mucilaginosa]|uniref:DUF3530 family protein n=1 Tax=Alkalimonas mucilaginosa TaxID=3057676 RepID=A0ABU7JEK5_9GAMM|nr:DUF3530 family protein [Alkalimonas sp. MEB004]MEE2024118.1 DUF3530 family protein [Alkalimonas sp. MEB004]